MFIVIQGRQYRLTFKHEVFSEPAPRHDGGAAQAITRCMISPQSSSNMSWMAPLAMGEAFCSVEDPFCRATGRKVALARALRKLFSDKGARRDAWGQYLGQTGILTR